MFYLLPCELNAFSLIRNKKVEKWWFENEADGNRDQNGEKKTKSFWKLELKINSIVFYDLSEAPHVSRSLILVIRVNTGYDS